MRKRLGSRLPAFLLAGSLCAGLSGADAVAAEPSAGEQGAWQRHELRFQYHGFTTIYSCDGLVAKLELLLKAAGARSDAKVRAGSCTEIGGHPDRFASAQLVYYTLRPATASDVDPVAAQWRRLRLAHNRPLELASGDCELVEQFRDEVLRKTFATRNLVDRVSCVPHQAFAPFALEVDVLNAR